FEIGSTKETEIGIIECVRCRVRLKIAIIDAKGPIPTVLQGGMSDPQSGDPTNVAAIKSSRLRVGQIRTAIVDRDRIDVVVIERDVFNPLSEQRHVERIEMREIETALDIDHSKRCCQTEVLELFDCPETVVDRRGDVADREIGVALLRE